MADNKNINVSGGLVPTTTNTPLDSRSRINTLGEVESISYPFIGMHFFVLDTKKEYIVDTLKSKEILGIEIPDSLIDEYHEFYDDSRIEGLEGDVEGMKETDKKILDVLSKMDKTLDNVNERLTKEEEAQDADEWLEI